MEGLSGKLRMLLGHDVEISAVERIEPWFVDRVYLRDGTSVIVKTLREDARDFRVDPAQVVTEFCALTFLNELGFELAPRVVASDLAMNMIALEDLGHRPSLFDLLLAGAPTADAAERSFVRALGQLHVTTVGLEGAFYEARSALGPVDPQFERERYMGTGWPETQSYVESLGAGLSSEAHAEMATVIGCLRDPGPFLAFSNGDACAFNFLVEGVEGKLIDFEFAGYRHALTDVACLYVPGSMWITVSDPVTRGLEADYREVLSSVVPEAADDDLYGSGIAAACLAFAVERLHRFPYVDRRTPGHLSRVQMISTLESAADTATAHGSFPHLAGWARTVADLLRRRWRDADVDPRRYRSYTPRIDGP